MYSCSSSLKGRSFPIPSLPVPCVSGCTSVDATPFSPLSSNAFLESFRLLFLLFLSGFNPRHFSLYISEERNRF